jgi:AcrR family transcriptional regulator
VARSRQRQARQDQLRAAAQRAIARHGIDGVQLTHVAEEAGVSPGTVLYHYPEVSELLLQACVASTERFHSGRQRRLQRLDDPAEQLVDLIASGLPTDPADVEVRLLCEIGGTAGRHPVYAELLTSLFDRQVEMYEVVLAQGVTQGLFGLRQPAATVARTIVALEDAYGYRIMAGHPTIDPPAAVELVLGYARLATGHPLATWPGPAAG